MTVIKILGLSDLHSRGRLAIQNLIEISETENIDLVAVSGDLTTYGKKDKVKNVLESLDKINKPIFYVPGNMDSTDSDKIQFSNVQPLHAKIRNFKGLNFIGLGASNPTPFNTPNEVPDEMLGLWLGKALQKKPNDDPLVLISHTPPLNSEADRIRSGTHVGSFSVRDFIEREKPVVVLCGHIHESKSISEIGDTLCVNPGAGAHGNAVVIEINISDEAKITAKAEFVGF
jgi:Icc-related predicted phosphoesterase